MPQVYLFVCEGRYKIGHTIDTNQRRRSMLTGNPFNVKVVHTIPTNKPKQLERHFHEKFKDKRVRGEWFDLTASDVSAFSDFTIQILREQLEHERRINMELIRCPVASPVFPAVFAASLRSLLTVVDVCELSQLSERRVRDALRSGALKGKRIGHGWRVLRADFDAWIDAQFV